MVEYLDTHPRTGAVGGKLLNPDRAVGAGYSYFSSLSETLWFTADFSSAVMPGLLSLVKLLVLAIMFVLPSRRDLARKELNSNLNAIGLCLKPA